MSENQENKIPTKEQLIAALQEQIEVKQVQLTLQKLNAELAKNRADELEAYAKIAHFSNKSSTNDNVVEHTVTQEDIDNNPEMSQQGIKVGDKIGIPKEVYDQFIAKKDSSQEQETSAVERKLKAVPAD